MSQLQSQEIFDSESTPARTEKPTPEPYEGKTKEVLSKNAAVLHLVLAARGGRDGAMEALLEKFRPLILTVAARYKSLSFDDAVQEGCLALIRCVYSFNEHLGVPFTGYLNLKLRGDVRTALRRMWKYENRTVSAQQETDTEGELNLWDAWMTKSWSEVAGSLYGGIGGSAGGSGPAPGSMSASSLSAATELSLVEWYHVMHTAGLTQREKLGVVTMMEGWSSTEVAQRMGVSKETVKTWRKRGIGKMRKALEVKAPTAEPEDE